MGVMKNRSTQASLKAHKSISNVNRASANAKRVETLELSAFVQALWRSFWTIGKGLHLSVYQ
jgi:hypothetical protein